MRKRLCQLFLLNFLLLPQLASANPLERGWTLATERSSIGFLSVKKGTIAEYSGFASFTGTIDPTGNADVTVALDSVDTNIDLRNVRMRFLFFETFKHSQARVSAQISSAQISDLAEAGRKTVELPVTLELHGVTVELSTRVALTLLDTDTVNVSTVQPIILSLADFDLLSGLEKLEEAANVTITPVGIVSLDLYFQRNGSNAGAMTQETTTNASVALETNGTFNRGECEGRFEVLSQSRSVNFAANSSDVAETSEAFLDALADIVNRCPDLKIEVGGHTDAWGKAAWNLELSRQRAVSVTKHLITKGADQSRLVAVGYGETAPLVGNSTADNRAKNRRIEFKVLN